MTDIKTREVITGTIKTLDRSASSMHRIKDETVHTRMEDLRSSDGDTSSTEEAQDTAERLIGYSAVLVARAGADVMGKTAVHAMCASVNHMRKTAEKNKLKKDEVSEIIEEDIEELEKRHLKKRGDSIAESVVSEKAGQKSRKPAVKDKRAMRERIRTGELVDIGSEGTTIQAKQKALWIRSGQKKAAEGGTEGIFRSLISRGSDGVKNFKYILANSNILNMGVVGGITAILIVVVMVLFGAALTMTDDGNRIVGFGDTAIVEVARAEIGNKGGEKYWKWYGFSRRVDWCAIFCSWCADQCGYIESGILPKFSIVGDGANWFKNRHRWAGRGYSPRPGDFIFFDYQQNGVLDHVGIVENCDGRTVTTIEGNSRDACKRLTYVIGSSSIAGYGLSVSMTSMTFENAITWAEKIAEDGSYHYVVFGDDPKTHECPVCNDHPEGSYRGWNCIGFAFACWRHGAGINCKCSCEVINDPEWDHLLVYSTDAEATQFATNRIGVPCKVIRNGGKAIPVSRLKAGDILCLFEGETSYHVIFYEGNGKYADCSSGGGDAIQAHNPISDVEANIKIAIRYGG